jgi:hypothetical protein
MMLLILNDVLANGSNGFNLENSSLKPSDQHEHLTSGWSKGITYIQYL